MSAQPVPETLDVTPVRIHEARQRTYAYQRPEKMANKAFIAAAIRDALVRAHAWAGRNGFKVMDTEHSLARQTLGGPSANGTVLLFVCIGRSNVSLGGADE